jgi:hypothetical protein
LVVCAILSASCGDGPGGAETAAGEGSASLLTFPGKAIRSGWRVFGFEIEIAGARVEDVLGITPGWMVLVGPETGARQQVSGHCLHGVSAPFEASMLPRFVVRGMPGQAGGARPEVTCLLIVTEDFEDFDTLDCDMRLDPGSPGR